MERIILIFQIYFFGVIQICPFIIVKGQNINHWQMIESVEDVCFAYPERMKTLLMQINLNSHELENVKTSLIQDQLALACKQLLAYYRDGTSASFLRNKKIEISSESDTLAENIIRNVMTFYGRSAVLPHRSDNHLDWTFHGQDDDMEWAWALNRHYHIQTLLDAYLKTGNPVYAKTIDKHIKDWVIFSMPYPEKRSNTEIWRGLEVSFRAKIWAKVFFGLINSGYLSPVTQLLILSSIPEHAHYLRNYHGGGNWLTMEMTGLATISTVWPEFNQSSQWFQYAVDTMIKTLDEQVYPDGAQTELSSSYHYVALDNFNQLIEICRLANKPLPQRYTSRIEAMWNYLSYIMRPDGFGPLNNDSDMTDWRKLVEKEAILHQRDDWKYIISNSREGIKPQEIPSVFFPWAGQLIMRNSYKPFAQWAFFDIGPWGTGHQHNDKLHLSVFANGHDFLVDSGRFAYDGELAEKFREYALNSASHNVILIDGQGQAPGPRLAVEPLSNKHCNITEDFDHAWHISEEYKNIDGICSHLRSLLYVRGQFWVVVDKITTDRPRTVEILWHWHPECQVNVERKQMVTAQNGQSFLQIIPLSKTKMSIRQVKGQETPTIQGWYSKKYNECEPNTVSIYKAQIQNNTTFIWVLLPSDMQTVKLDVKLISQCEENITLMINYRNEKFWVNVPFGNSDNVSVKKESINNKIKKV